MTVPTSLGRLIQVLPQEVFGSTDKHQLINGAPYVALVSGCSADLAPQYDFAFGGTIEWIKHRSDAVVDEADTSFLPLMTSPNGEAKNFKLVFFDKKIDITDDAVKLLFEAKLVVRLWEYFSVDNMIKAVVLRNQFTWTSFSEHLIYMDTAQP